MKSVIKLNVEFEVVCTEEYADKLRSNLAKQVLSECFKFNNRRVLSATITDTELVDNTVDVSKLLNSRNEAEAEQFDDPSPVTKSFINLL